MLCFSQWLAWHLSILRIDGRGGLAGAYRWELLPSAARRSSEWSDFHPLAGNPDSCQELRGVDNDKLEQSPEIPDLRQGMQYPEVEPLSFLSL